jgi:hypothetical protein
LQYLHEGAVAGKKHGRRCRFVTTCHGLGEIVEEWFVSDAQADIRFPCSGNTTQQE